MSKKIINPTAIDERFFLESIHDEGVGSTKNALPSRENKSENEEPIIKDPAKRKRGCANYDELYLQRNEIKSRKAVYVSSHIHSVISKIISSIADNELSVGGYIDNVLKQHLEAHKDEINKLYRQEKEDLL